MTPTGAVPQCRVGHQKQNASMDAGVTSSCELWAHMINPLYARGSAKKMNMPIFLLSCDVWDSRPNAAKNHK